MRRLIISCAVCLVVGLAGCGGDDGGDEEQAPAGGGEGAAVETVKVTETEFKLDPANPTIEKTGAVAFEVSNEGQADHSLEVEGPQGEAELEKNLKPGESATLEVNLDRAGSYEWYCPVGNHRDLGMEGRVTVGGAESPPPGDDDQSQGSGSDDSSQGSGSDDQTPSSGGSPY